MHKTYESILKHKADFRVKYKFRGKEEGGRDNLPYQGIRCDFVYFDEPDSKVYIVRPEFEHENGEVILENNVSVPKEGTALMWIINPERRIIHRDIIKKGTTCFFWEGKISADCEVIEILDLFKNPIKPKAL